MELLTLEAWYLIYRSEASISYFSPLEPPTGLVLLDLFIQDESGQLIACSGEKTMMVLACHQDERGNGGMLC